MRHPALYFTCLDRTDSFLRGVLDWDSPVLSTLRTFMLGATSRSVAAVVFCPITVVKTRMVCALKGFSAGFHMRAVFWASTVNQTPCGRSTQP